MSYLLEHESYIRSFIFVTILVIMMVWEWFFPRRQLLLSRFKRWPANVGIVIINSVLVRVIFPTATIGMAIWVQQQQWGLFNNTELPILIELLLAIIFLDLVIYAQHVLVHHVPLLWRLHKVHHADLGFDVTTGSRFHPIEIVFSMGVKFLAICIIGCSAEAAIIFEIILNFMAMFNHSNIQLPIKLDRLLRTLVVTPDMHRVHHSIIASETNSNYGFNLSIWDRIFKTYIKQPQNGHIDMTIGIKQFRAPSDCSQLTGLLFLPFKKAK